MFKRIIILLISIFMCSCATNYFSPEPILDAAFPHEEYDNFFPDIKFQVGYYGNEKGMYGFQVDRNKLLIASKDFETKVITKNHLDLEFCPSVITLIESLKYAVLDSSEMILGFKYIQKSDVIMLHGLFYELYWEGRGGSRARA